MATECECKRPYCVSHGKIGISDQGGLDVIHKIRFPKAHTVHGLCQGFARL